jgi:ESS family glutamate:Na+ symporter
LIIFFITIGLSSKLSTLIAGGKSLLILLVMAISYLFIQNFTGIGVALLSGVNPVAGILGGSVSFSGGHGTTIAWAPVFFSEYGIARAAEVGIACATFGLITGGVIGGPIAKVLINRYQLKSEPESAITVGKKNDSEPIRINYDRALKVIFIIFVTGGAGIYLNKGFAWLGLSLPLFVTSLFAGIIITNLIPVVFKNIGWDPQRSNSVAMASELSLGLFLAMSLMSLRLWDIATLPHPYYW